MAAPPSVPTFPISGVPCTVYLGDGDGSDAVTEQVSQDGATATVLIKCPWAQRYAVVGGLLGGVASKNGVLTRVIPALYPPSPNLFCTSISNIKGIQPIRDDSGEQGLKGWITYTWAIITAVFSRPTWQAFDNPQQGEPESTDPSGIIYATTRFKVSTENFTPPFGAYFWQGGEHQGEAVEGATLTEIRPRVEISITRHMMPTPGLVSAINLVGCVNQFAWLIGGYSFPKGTVLFPGMNTEPKADPATQVTTWDIELTFLANTSFDWNQFMDPDGNYQFINTQITGGGNGPFPYADFSPLLSDGFL